MRYLVDTDWAIDYMNGIQTVVRQLDELSDEGAGISIISLAELYDGLVGATDPERDEQRLNDFLDSIEVVPLEDAVCRIFAQERYRLRTSGLPIDNLDLFIAATAVHHGLTLLTNNRRHFERVRGLNIVSV